jgi:thymidine phosphorylase
MTSETPVNAPIANNGGVNAARLALRRVLIDTYHENVAYMHRDCDIYRAEGFKALSKVEVRTDGRSILATLNVVDDQAIVACGELGLSKAAFAQMGVEDGHTVSVGQAEPPESMGALHRKLSGERLHLEDFRAIVQDIAEHHYSKIELTAFVVATNRDELDREEVYFLTEAMIDVGHHLTWHETLDWRHPWQPHLHADRAHRGGARHAVPQDLVARHHLASRHGRHDGSTGQRRIAG